MKLCVSNIAWKQENDREIYECMNALGFKGLEIAPSRTFPDTMYDDLDIAAKWAGELKAEWGFSVPSMQSILFGCSDSIFGSVPERESVLGRLKRAIDFAASVGCNNLVFGCPKNRSVPEGKSHDEAVSFFKEVSAYAETKGTHIGIEANPAIYNTNFLNYTKDALAFIDRVNSPSFKLNLDVGTMIQNNEDISILKGRAGLISHVHISEPYLKPVEKRKLHQKLAKFLEDEGYNAYVSLEIATVSDMNIIKDTLVYMKEVFA